MKNLFSLKSKTKNKPRKVFNLPLIKTGFFLLSLVFLFFGMTTKASASTCTLNTGTYATLAATAGNWTGSGCTGVSYVPAVPDIVIIPSGATMHIASGESLAMCIVAHDGIITISGT